MLNKPFAAVSVAIAVTAAQITGASFRPDRDPETDHWYRALDKSPLTPPGPVFGVVWTVLDALLAYSGYRIMTAGSKGPKSPALVCWTLSLLGVVAHPWTMFGRKRLDEATVVTIGMVAASTGLMTAAAAVDRRAAWAAAPLMGWVMFAMYLQEEVWRRNRGK